MTAKINADIIPPNTAHGRYEFDRLNAQPAREKYLDTCAFSIRIGQSRVLFSRRAARFGYPEGSRVMEEIDKLERRYLDTGVVSRDAVHITSHYIDAEGNDAKADVWIKMIPAEDIAKLALSEHIIKLPQED